MRSRIAGGIAVFVLVLAGFAPVARADGFRVGTTALGANHDAVPDSGAWTSTDDFVASFLAARNDSGTVNGAWSFKTVNPFRDAGVRDGFDQVGVVEARAFLSSAHAGSRSARLDFTVKQTGDRNGDDMDDFHLTLTQATFVPGAPAAVESAAMASGLGQVELNALNAGGVSALALGTQAQPLPTPEPASLILLGSGLVGVVVGMRKRRG